MRFNELLTETYNRNTILKQYTDKLVAAFQHDKLMVPELHSYIDYKHKKDITPEAKAHLVNAILTYIENKDPTSQKKYSAWMAKVYSNGDVKLEDLNRNGLINIFDLGRRRHIIKPEHSNINVFKTYRQFEDTISNMYDLDEIEKVQKKALPAGSATNFYSNDKVRIVIPNNQEAACYYGQNTRWCTAARNENKFDYYNSTGKLYIMIPTQPKHNGEKYQVHFQSWSYNDESDDYVNPIYVMKQRFGNLIPIFKDVVPDIEDYVIFLDEGTLSNVLDNIQDAVDEHIREGANDYDSKFEARKYYNENQQALADTLHEIPDALLEYPDTKLAELPYLIYKTASYKMSEDVKNSIRKYITIERVDNKIVVR